MTSEQVELLEDFIRAVIADCKPDADIYDAATLTKAREALLDSCEE